MNIYDEMDFFQKYKDFPRSRYGLSAAGEWHELKKLLNFDSKNVLDLGCGFGWHCFYAAENNAKSIIGVDISKNMLEIAAAKNTYKNIEFINQDIENFVYKDNFFDIIFSSLVFHYISDFDSICKKSFKMLKKNGEFIFSAEHPIFTAYGNQDWIYDENGNILHWPVDNYFDESYRDSIFLGHNVRKYHRTLTTYLSTLTKNNFIIKKIVEPKPDPTISGMENELRRPMMLIISAQKP